MNSSSSDLNGMSVSSPRSSSVYSNINEARNNKVKRYWAKKQNRVNQKTVRYGCRQNLARQRYRYQGRFITKKEMEMLDAEQIYDPNLRQVPRVKNIFKIHKEHHRSASCRSAHSTGSSGQPLIGVENHEQMPAVTLGGILPLGQIFNRPVQQKQIEVEPNNMIKLNGHRVQPQQDVVMDDQD